ncbi:hypothetical protein Btru_059737 [Bulinus truncatus]|nr:hypothetical protein Btru_059737 [Bulinus truncatus]
MKFEYGGIHLLASVVRSLVIAFLVDQFLLLGLGSCETVQVNYTSSDITKQPLPDDVDVTIGTDNDTYTVLHLKRVPHITLDIPVYTIGVDSQGLFVHRREKLKDRKNIGYYQDPSHEAVIQITRTNDLGESKAQLKMEGMLHVSGSKHSLLPEDHSRLKRSAETTNNSSDDVNLYVLQTVPQNPSTGHDYLEPPPEIKVSIPMSNYQNPSFTTTPEMESTTPSSAITSFSLNNQRRRRRRRREATQIVIDVVAIIDNGAYQRFLAAAGSRAKAISDIQEYYAFIFNGVDLRYQGIRLSNYLMNVKLRQIFISENVASSPFTEPFRKADKPWDEVDARSALDALKNFLVSQRMLDADHYMLMTGYDLTSVVEGTVTTNSTTGLAFTGTLCRTDGTSISVVEDLGGFQSIDTAAHELGHSLNARHDGDKNNCSSTDRYIMAGGSSRETTSNRLNPWLFSPCSISAFTTFIQTTLQSSHGVQCLMDSLITTSSVPDVSARNPGEEYTPDQQCRMIYGNTSRMCRGIEFGNASSICTSMFCFDPNTDLTCFEHTAARGTSCGNEKECIDGDCRYRMGAPEADENCVFGDQPGSAFDGKTCKNFVGSYSGYCYQAVVLGRCCASCKTFYRPIMDCEYGDKATGCTQDICRRGLASDLQKCCGTCNYGTPITTTQPTTQKRPAIVFVTTPAPSVTITASNVPPTTRPSRECLDNPNILVNNMSCSTATIMNPEFCYQAEMMIACCESCQKINSGFSGCEYGDKYPSSCRDLTFCRSNAYECCNTCGRRSSCVGTNIYDYGIIDDGPLKAIRHFQLGHQAFIFSMMNKQDNVILNFLCQELLSSSVLLELWYKLGTIQTAMQNMRTDKLPMLLLYTCIRTDDFFAVLYTYKY